MGGGSSVPVIDNGTGMYTDKFKSNPEVTDPFPSLDWKSVADAKDLTFIGECADCVGASKVHLDYHDIKYEMLPIFSPVPDTKYPLIPVIRAAGRQVNGNYMINKTLIPLLYGPESFNEEWESKIHFGLSTSMNVHVINGGEVAKWLNMSTGMPKLFGFLNVLLKKTMLGIWGPDGSLKKASGGRYQHYADLTAFGNEFKGAMGDNPFFGGAKESSVDLSFYGAVAIFYYCDLSIKKSLIEDAGLQPWWDRMAAIIPPTKLLPAHHLYTVMKGKNCATYRPWLMEAK